MLLRQQKKIPLLLYEKQSTTFQHTASSNSSNSATISLCRTNFTGNCIYRRFTQNCISLHLFGLALNRVCAVEY